MKSDFIPNVILFLCKKCSIKIKIAFFFNGKK